LQQRGSENPREGISRKYKEEKGKNTSRGGLMLAYGVLM